MSNLEAYEQNLEKRLIELRAGDPAHKLHTLSILETLIYAIDSFPIPIKKEKRRILDVGCGLGFLTKAVSEIRRTKVIGIDPSKKAISLARNEHSNVSFEVADAQSYKSKILFDYAILNMVLHSVDDPTGLGILSGIHHNLRVCGGLIMIVPTKDWLMQKLIEYAQDQNMPRIRGILWVQDQLAKDQVELFVKIRNGEYYPKPITIFNRTPEDYGNMLLQAGFGVDEGEYTMRGRHVKTVRYPYYNPWDYLCTYELRHRERLTMLTYAQLLIV